MKDNRIILRIVKADFPGALDKTDSIEFRDGSVDFTLMLLRTDVHLFAKVDDEMKIDERIGRDRFTKERFSYRQKRMAELVRRLRMRKGI